MSLALTCTGTSVRWAPECNSLLKLLRVWGVHELQESAIRQLMLVVRLFFHEVFDSFGHRARERCGDRLCALVSYQLLGVRQARDSFEMRSLLAGYCGQRYGESCPPHYLWGLSDWVQCKGVSKICCYSIHIRCSSFLDFKMTTASDAGELATSFLWGHEGRSTLPYFDCFWKHPWADMSNTNDSMMIWLFHSRLQNWNKGRWGLGCWQAAETSLAGSTWSPAAYGQCCRLEEIWDSIPCWDAFRCRIKAVWGPDMIFRYI